MLVASVCTLRLRVLRSCALPLWFTDAWALVYLVLAVFVGFYVPCVLPIMSLHAHAPSCSTPTPYVSFSQDSYPHFNPAHITTAKRTSNHSRYRHIALISTNWHPISTNGHPISTNWHPINTNWHPISTSDVQVHVLYHLHASFGYMAPA